MRSGTVRGRSIVYDRAAMINPTPSSDLRTLLGDGAPDAVPDFIWYELALKALEPETPPPTRLAALRLLARAPRSWDAVAMAALTTTDLVVQLAALETLAAHVGQEPERLGAFERLGELPAWHPSAHEAWGAAWREMAEAHEAARRERLLRDLNGRVAELTAEIGELHEAGAALQRELGASRKAEGEALERLEALEAASAAEAARLEAEARRARGELEAGRDAYAAERRMLVEAAREADGTRRRWQIATAVAIAAAVGPLALLAGGRAPVMATEPPARPAAVQAALQAGEAHRAVDRGWAAAVDALAGEAARLEAAGRLYPALTAWQCAAKLAHEPAAVKRATGHADALEARIGRAAPETRFVRKPAARKAAAPKPPAPKAIRPAAPKAGGAAPARPADPIPADVRAKF